MFKKKLLYTFGVYEQLFWPNKNQKWINFSVKLLVFTPGARFQKSVYSTLFLTCLDEALKKICFLQGVYIDNFFGMIKMNKFQC